MSSIFLIVVQRQLFRQKSKYTQNSYFKSNENNAFCWWSKRIKQDIKQNLYEQVPVK